ncbi:hypothetical protein ABZW30_33315 [Kitasatospora sp. NPDC004669]|uniref:hypothetical protein n=1 Tax=Kitasatospora sp. NPDC004669 TaxID=3154555 RepID=UPI00339F6BDC
MEHDRRVVELFGEEIGDAELVFTQYINKDNGRDVAHKNNFPRDYKDLARCG